MITRKLIKETDFQQFAEVSASAYVYNIEETEFEEDVDIFGTFINDGKTLISQMECGFKKTLYCGKEIICAAVGGVASKPEYRRMGGVRETFNGVFQHALSQGAIISILSPFSINYYRKFGYETIFRYINAQCSFKAFEKIQRFSDVTLATEDNKDILLDIYNTLALKNNLMYVRGNEKGFCFKPYKECKYTYFLNDPDSKGYVSFTLDRPSKTVSIDEIVFADKNALLKLLGFIRVYDGNYDTVKINKLPLNTPLLGLLTDENKFVTRNLLYGDSGRILDMEALLNATVYPQEKGEFSLKLTDNQIEKNNGVYNVKYENGKAVIEKSENGNYDIGLDALAAARIILGREGLTADEISYIPNTEINGDCHDFLRVFHKATTLFYDSF